jgi:Flp pilus assembly protein TadB
VVAEIHAGVGVNTVVKAAVKEHVPELAATLVIQVTNRYYQTILNFCHGQN